MYSKIYSRLDWFFDYIGEPQEDFIPDLYGDVNFDGSINISDIVIMVNFVLGQTPTDEQFINIDFNNDNLITVQDIVNLVSLIIESSTSFIGSATVLNFGSGNINIFKVAMI